MLLQPLIASRAPRMGLVGLSPPENGYGAKESPYGFRIIEIPK